MRPIYNVDCGSTPKDFQSKFKTLHNTNHSNNRKKEDDTETEWRLKSVKTLIDAFEQKGRALTRTNLSKIKSKSFANLLRDKTEVKKSEPHFASIETRTKAKEVINLFEKTFSSSTHRIYDTAALELEVIKNNALVLHTKITNFVGNDSNECMTYQNQIIGLLTKIGSLESNGNQLIKQEKQSCLKIVQNCNIILKGKIRENVENNNHTEYVETKKNQSPPTTVNTYEQECGSKVQQLKNIFESKREVQNSYTSSTKTYPHVTKNTHHPPPSNYSERYVPYSDYIKQNNNNTSQQQRKSVLEMSRSCEDVSKNGIRRLLEILQDVKAKKLRRSKSEFHIQHDISIDENHSDNSESRSATPKTEEEHDSLLNINETSIKTKEKQLDDTIPLDGVNGISNGEEIIGVIAGQQLNLEEVTLVSVKLAKEEEDLEADHSNFVSTVIVDQQYENDKFSNSDEDSCSENGVSSGFYSLISGVAKDEETTYTNGEMEDSKSPEKYSTEDGSVSDEDSDKSYFTVKSRNESFNEQELLSPESSSPNLEEQGSLVSNVLVDYNDNGLKTCFSGVSYTPTNLDKSVHIH